MKNYNLRKRLYRRPHVNSDTKASGWQRIRNYNNQLDYNFLKGLKNLSLNPCTTRNRRIPRKRCFVCRNKGHTRQNYPSKQVANDPMDKSLMANDQVKMDADYVQLHYDTIGLKGDFLVEGTDKENWNKIWYVNGTTCVIRRMFEEANDEMTMEEVLEIQNAYLEKYFQEFITSTTNEGRDSADTNLIKQEVEIPLKSSKGIRLNNDERNLDAYEICLFDLYKLVKCFGGYERLNYKKKWDEVSLGFGFSRLYGFKFKEIYVHYLLILETYIEAAKVNEVDIEGTSRNWEQITSIKQVTHSDANMASDLQPMEDVLLWPGECHGRTEDTIKENMSGRAEYRERTGPMTADTKKENMTGHVERHGRTEPMTADAKKENMSGRAKYCKRTGPMTADTKKENMSEHAKRHGRTEPMTTDSKKENMTGHAERHGRTDPMTADTKKENMSGRAEYRGRMGPMTADTKKENISGHAKRHGRTKPMTTDSKKENMSGRA
nr:hypothetical protein [Tanacetum cinerariifolium]